MHGAPVRDRLIHALREDPTATEEITSGASGSEEGDDDGLARRSVFSSSLGVTFLVSANATALHVTARWATYSPETTAKSSSAACEPAEREG